jgi:SNF2 family DNA or RNA helicase
MGIRDLLTKVIRSGSSKEFSPDFSDESNIKIFLKQDGRNVKIDNTADDDIFVLVNVTNLSISEDKTYLYISYDKIYELYEDNNKSVDDYLYLGLPELFKGFIHIENQGNFIESKSVKYSFKFANGLDYDIRRIKKNLISVNGEYKILSKEMYHLLQEVVAYNMDSSKFEEPSEQFGFFAKVKDYTEKTNVLLNTRLREENKPLIIDKIKLDFLEQGDALEIVPVIDGESDEFNQKFLDKFDRAESVKNFYNIDHDGKKRKIVFKDKSSAEKVKRNRRLTGDEKSKFCQGDNELLIDEDKFDLSEYGPRVKGIGYLNYRSNAPVSSKNTDESWFDFERVVELPTLETDEEVFVLKPEDRDEFQKKLFEIDEENRELIDIELQNEDKSYKIPMSKDQILKELRKINNSTIDVDKINSLSDLEEISAKVTENKPYVEHKGRYVKHFGKDFIESRITSLKENSNSAQKKEKKKELTLLVKDNLEELEHSEVGKAVIKDEVELPKALKMNLFDHQKEGLRRLQNLYKASNINGFLLADDMGLGKTLQILSFLAWMKENYKLKPTLMVSPTTLIDNWDNEDVLNPGEIQKCFENGTFTTYKIRGTINAANAERELELIRSADIVLTSYESLRINHKVLGQVHWCAMVCDEMQKAKNATTLVSVALKSQNADFKIACSATPIENTTLDLWNIMDFSVPGILGSLKDFKKNYVNRINNLTNEHLEERQELNNSLVSKIENNFLRRSKEEELKGLPNKHIKVHLVSANDNERRLSEELNLMKRPGESALPLIQKMIALCSHEDLIHQGSMNNVEELVRKSAKLKILKQILDEVRAKGEKALVFSIFKRMQEIIILCLKHWYGMNCSVVNGDIDQSKRKDIFNAFRKKEGFNVIVLSPEVAGVGITLTEANHVIHYTRLWNPAKESQATDRAYRIGQSKDVFVHYPILTFGNSNSLAFNNEQDYISHFLSETTKGKSPEEKLNKLLVRKKNMLNNFFLAAGESKVDVSNEWDDEEKTEERHMSINNVINTLKADEFEGLCSLLYRKMGYTTFLTVRSGDKGVDVVAEKDNKYTLIQCKLTSSKNVHSSALREVFGAKNIYASNLGVQIEKTVVITTSEEITVDTKEFSKTNEVEVITKKKLAELLEEYRIYYSEIELENEKRYSIEQIIREVS